MVQRAREHRHAREGILLQLLQQPSQAQPLGHGKDRRPRRHHLAHHLVAELHRRPHQFAVALLQDALLLARLQQRLHRLRRMLLLRGVLRLGQRHDRQQQAQCQRHRQNQVEERLQQIANARNPQPARPRKQDLRNQPVEEQNQQHQKKRRHRNVFDARRPRQQRIRLHVHIQPQPRDQRYRRQRKLPQHRRRQRQALPPQVQPRLDRTRPRVDVVLMTRAPGTSPSRCTRGPHTRPAPAPPAAPPASTHTPSSRPPPFCR